MNRAVHVEVLFYDGEYTHLFGKLTYEAFLQNVLRSGVVTGFTVTRAWSGLDASRHLQRMQSDSLNDHVPVCVQIVTTIDNAERLLTEMQQMKDLHCRVMMRQAVDLKSRLGDDDLQFDSETDGAVVKVYMNEDDQVDGVPLALRLLRALREVSPLWADVEHAMEGYGQSRKVHKPHWFSTQPESMILEAVCMRDTLPSTLNALSDLIPNASGPAILMPGRIVHFGNTAHRTQSRKEPYA